MKKNKVILSGGFSPCHSGHVKMIQNASFYGDVIILLNSDEWVKNKRGHHFIDFEDRKSVLLQFKGIEDVLSFEDDEYGSALNGLKKVRELYNKAEYKLFFGNGGDKNENSTPMIEQKYCEENDIELIWGLGGDKTQSSSWILNRYRDHLFEITERNWGKYYVLYNDSNKKIKILEINPNSFLSLQSHKHRSENWFVIEGLANVEVENTKYVLSTSESIFIPKGVKHRLSNNTDKILKIVEIQLGNYVGEDDIIRY